MTIREALPPLLASLGLLFNAVSVLDPLPPLGGAPGRGLVEKIQFP